FYLQDTPNQQQPGKRLKEDRLLAFVLTPKHEPVLVNLGKAEPIRQLLQEWRTAVEHEATTVTLDTLGRKLRAPSGEQLLTNLRGNDTVLIAPDGELCQLPFGALPGARKGTYLLEDYALAYLVSGRQLLELNAAGQRQVSHGLLAIGGLKYDAPRGL